MKAYRPEACPVQEKFAATRLELAATLIERDEEVDLVLTALVAQEHVLLVGAPGCAKSLLLDAVMNWLHGRRFSVLFTKFTCPEEVFGAVSIAGLKEDKYQGQRQLRDDSRKHYFPGNPQSLMTVAEDGVRTFLGTSTGLLCWLRPETCGFGTPTCQPIP